MLVYNCVPRNTDIILIDVPPPHCVPQQNLFIKNKKRPHIRCSLIFCRKETLITQR